MGIQKGPVALKSMNCFTNKTILITGHTGFQGFWLANALYLLKVKKIIGLGLPPKNYQQKLFRHLEKSKIINKSYFVNVCNKKKFHDVLKKDTILLKYLSKEELKNILENDEKNSKIDWIFKNKIK